MGICCLLCINNESFAASRTNVRPVSTTARKSAAKAPVANTTASAQNNVKEVVIESAAEIKPEPLNIENKSSQFEDVVSTVTDGVEDNAFAEQIRKQRNAFDVSESSRMVAQQQQAALTTGRNACDSGLRECMMAKCGNDFTKCALDGDTIFGDKLNACRKDLTCTGEEFRLFTTEIKADRDLNARLSSYTKVVDCGNNYNRCIIEECGDTYTKCLGKATADKAIQKCSTIAKQCTEQDSGLASRFGTVIGKLRETAEQDVKTDEARMYTIRDTMKTVCSGLGAMFDERSFDCVFTVNFFAGENQSTPMASRKRYAGDTFVCLQEWFGTNVTTFKENAFRETRAQTAASSAMLGSGVGTAAGLISSGAIDRALDTQKAKKELKKACEEQDGKKLNIKGECVDKNTNSNEDSDDDEQVETEAETPESNNSVSSSTKGSETEDKNPAEKLRQKVEAMDIEDVKETNIRNDLKAAEQRGTQKVLGDQRTYQQRALDKAVGDYSLKEPAALSTPITSKPTSTPSTGKNSFKLETKPLSSSIGFKKASPTI